jgi:hypothetical protein
VHFKKVWQQCAQIVRNGLQTLIDFGVERGEGQGRGVRQSSEFTTQGGRQSVTMGGELGPLALIPTLLLSSNAQQFHVLCLLQD